VVCSSEGMRGEGKSSSGMGLNWVGYYRQCMGFSSLIVQHLF
jgi:hypothetical protein